MLAEPLHTLQNISNDPTILGLTLGMSTLILEDAATISGATLAANGNISVWWALSVLYAGIIIGDAALYMFGRFASKYQFVKKFLKKRGAVAMHDKLKGKIFTIVFIARFIPGMRLTVYSACGLFRLSFTRFISATALASCLWTSGLFAITYALGEIAVEQLGMWRWSGSIILIIAVIILPRLLFKKKLNQNKAKE